MTVYRKNPSGIVSVGDYGACLSRAEAAKRLGVSVEQVDALCEEGSLHSVSIPGAAHRRVLEISIARWQASIVGDLDALGTPLSSAKQAYRRREELARRRAAG
jgi:hypothetical protein